MSASSKKQVTKLTGHHRKKALQTLQKVTIQFVKEAMANKKRFSQAVINAAGGKIFTYGSYRLGVYGPGRIYSTPLGYICHDD